MHLSRSSFGILALASLLACEPAEPMLRAEGFASGTRLRARVLDGGDGARAFTGWQDTQLDEPCRYRQTGPDTFHCLPGTFGGGLWADSGCSQPVVVEYPRTCSPSRYRISGGYESVRPFVMQGERMSGLTTVFAGTPQDCRSVPLSADASVHAIVPVELSTFVSATPRTTVHASRLSSSSLLGSDGSRELVRLFDPETNATCRASGTSDVRCLPDSALGTSFFADAACTERVVMGTGGRAPAVIFAEWTACSTADPELYAIGAAVPNDALFRQTSEGCTPSTAGVGVGSSVAYHRLGARIDRSAFPAMRWDRNGTGRLVVRSAATPDGYHVPSPFVALFEDTQSGPCTVLEFADGSPRCVPRSGLAASLGPASFVDSMCTRPIIHDHGTCSTAAPTFTLTAESPACLASPRVRAFSVGPRLAPGTTVYFQQTSGCEPYMLGDSPAYEPGPEMAPDAFPLVTARTI